MPEEAETEEVEERENVADIRTVLPGKIVFYCKDEGEKEICAEGMEVLADSNFDILALWGYDCKRATLNLDEEGNLQPTAGRVFRVGEAIVIAPDGWN